MSHLLYFSVSFSNVKTANNKTQDKTVETSLLGQEQCRCIAAELRNILRQYTGFQDTRGRGLLAASTLHAKQHKIHS